MRATGAPRLVAMLAIVWLAVAACEGFEFAIGVMADTPFADDLAFLRQHTNVIVLADGTGAQVVVAPEYQGRVMTSTAGGDDEASFGWIGRAAITSGKRQPHMNVFGGEDRFWLGPEGGQYALYFKPGDPFDLEHWQVPEPIDWGAWEVTKQSATAATFTKRMRLKNYAKTEFDIGVERRIRLLDHDDLWANLGLEPVRGLGPVPAVRFVAFESSNTVTNMGGKAWEADSGLVSIWILGMFKPSPTTTVVVPFRSGPESKVDPIVNDAYFGKVPADRLVVKQSAIFFKGDGQYRSKIGVTPLRAQGVAGSYDATHNVLTVVQYDSLFDASRYVNSMWEIQRDPWSGDVINSYNDGPPAPGKPPLGPFYELETSSHALSLAPGKSYTHTHRTYHFVGRPGDLDPTARALLKATIPEIRDVWGPR